MGVDRQERRSNKYCPTCRQDGWITARDRARRSSHQADFLRRHLITRDRLGSDLDDSRLRRHRRAESGDHVVGRGVRAAERDLLDDHAIAAASLIPGRHHPTVVLVGDDDLVASFQVDAGDQRLHPFRCVASDGHLFRIAAELASQLASDRLDSGVEDVPATSPLRDGRAGGEGSSVLSSGACIGEAPFNSLRSRGSVDTINQDIGQDIDFAAFSKKPWAPASLLNRLPGRPLQICARAIESPGVFSEKF